MSRWHVRVEVYPSCTGRPEQAGDRFRDGEFDAPDFGLACKLAEEFCKGVKSGPGCWQANIVKLAVLERTIIPKATLKPEQIVEINRGEVDY
jgi:hypothetical protein